MDRDAGRATQALFKFLALPQHESKEYRPINASRTTESMIEETRILLIEYFRPLNEALSDLTGMDLRWDY